MGAPREPRGSASSNFQSSLREKAIATPYREAAAAFEIGRHDDWLVVTFREMQRTASWAIVGGGLGRARTVAWLQVSDDDLRPPVDPRSFLSSRLASIDPDAVGLLTGRDLDAFVVKRRSYGGEVAHCVATVGLSNALRAGDLPEAAERAGTINVLCCLSSPLTSEALLEGLALGAEARTLAVHEARLPSRVSGAFATGTGTDCIVLATPESQARIGYAGKHTVTGHLIGAVVHEAVAQGIRMWKEPQIEPPRAR